jgi:hypothetical protein
VKLQNEDERVCAATNKTKKFSSHCKKLSVHPGVNVLYGDFIFKVM